MACWFSIWTFEEDFWWIIHVNLIQLRTTANWPQPAEHGFLPSTARKIKKKTACETGYSGFLTVKDVALMSAVLSIVSQMGGSSRNCSAGYHIMSERTKIRQAICFKTQKVCFFTVMLVWEICSRRKDFNGTCGFFFLQLKACSGKIVTLALEVHTAGD